jgi:uncharacterized protein (TIGR02466 family)
MNTIKINEVQPFKTSFFHTQVKGMTSLLPTVEKLTQRYNSVTISNAGGGWQSPSFHNYNDIPEFEGFLRIAQVFVQDLMRKYHFDSEAQLANYWININPPGAYNKPHRHAGSRFSTVMYINVPENSGDLMFRREDFWDEYLYGQSKTGTDEYNTTEWSLPPYNDQLVIFPANITHYVETNQSNELRVSIAANWR